MRKLSLLLRKTQQVIPRRFGWGSGDRRAQHNTAEGDRKGEAEQPAGKVTHSEFPSIIGSDNLQSTMCLLASSQPIHDRLHSPKTVDLAGIAARALDSFPPAP